MNRCRCGALDCRKCYPCSDTDNRWVSMTELLQQEADHLMDLQKDREMDWGDDERED